LYNIKKVTLIYFPFTILKKSIREKKKIQRGKKIENILKGKKLKVKKFVVGVLGAAPLCSIHGAIAENTLFEDGDGAHTFRVFNSTQVFLHLKKKYY